MTNDDRTCGTAVAGPQAEALEEHGSRLHTAITCTARDDAGMLATERWRTELSDDRHRSSTSLREARWPVKISFAALAWAAGVALLAAAIFVPCTPLQVVTHRVSTNEASAPAARRRNHGRHGPLVVKDRLCPAATGAGRHRQRFPGCSGKRWFPFLFDAPFTRMGLLYAASRRPVNAGRAIAGGNTHQQPSSCRKKKIACEPLGAKASTRT